MTTAKRIDGLSPLEKLDALANEIDGIKRAIGMPVDDQIDLLRLDDLAAKLGCTTQQITRMVRRAGRDTVEIGVSNGAQRYVRKPIWLEVLQHCEQRRHDAEERCAIQPRQRDAVSRAARSAVRPRNASGGTM